MKKRLRIGIVGCGGIARAHVSGYKNNGLDIAAVYDVVPKAAEAMAEQTGADVAPSLSGMATGMELDAVSICTPPAMHLDGCRPFIQAGVAILCEKPLEVDATRAARLVKAAAGSKAPFMTAFCHRYHPPVIELKKLLKKGTLGKPVFFRNIFGGTMNLKGNHRIDLAVSGGGALIDHGCHAMDLFRHLVGNPTHAQAVKANLMQMFDIEDFGMMQLIIDGGAVGEIVASYSLVGCSNWIELFCTKGAARIAYWVRGQPELSWIRLGDKDWTTPDLSGEPDRFTAEIAHFIDCVRNGKKPEVSAVDGLEANRIVRAVYNAATTGRRTAIPKR